MKLKFFIRRSISTSLMLILTVISAVLAIIMFGIGAAVPRLSVYFPLMLFGDMLFPLLLFIPALFFRNRLLTLTATLCSFTNIFLRLAAIIVFKETYMPLTFNSIKILLDHSDLYSLEAVLGKGFFFWLIPLAAIIISAISYCSVISWKTAGKSHRKISRWAMAFFSILLCLSLISNLIFQLACPNQEDHYFAIRPLPIVSMDIANDTIRTLRNPATIKTVPLPFESAKLLTVMDMIPPQETVENIPSAAFDRIIIIAAESLDLGFISFFNPEMPDGITPNLDRLARQYPAMTNYFSAAQPTSWGLTALLSSRLDYEKDRFIRQPSLFSAARRNGYESYYFSSASGDFGHNRINYFQLFDPDRQFFLEEWQKYHSLKSESYWGISDEKLFDAVFSELKKIKASKFIAVISTMDTHPPYFVPPADAEEVPPEFDNRFLTALHNTDRAIGDFIEKLTADKELFNLRTLIIITADHTATHGENYLNRHNFIPERIPLILISGNPEVFQKLDTGKYASSIDLAPTLLKLTGSRIPENFMGRELFSDKNIAITRTLENALIVHDRNGTEVIEYLNPADNLSDRSRALCDYYFSFYGNTQ